MEGKAPPSPNSSTNVVGSTDNNTGAAAVTGPFYGPGFGSPARGDVDETINDQLIRDGQAKIENEITTNYPLVSDSIAIDRLHGEYDQADLVYQQKVEDLKTNYISLRKTRPDGNCFYRAFIFSYFESLFGDEAEQQRFEAICKITRKGIADVLGFPDFTIDEFYEYFFNITQDILHGRITTADQLLTELDAPAVYDNIVVYLRLLTSYYLQKESDFFTAFIDGGGSIGDFCKREVEPMYKESDHIHIIALSSVLEVTVRIVYMDRGAGGKVNEHDFNPLKAEGPPGEPRIHLLYRPGHYDVLYGRNHPAAAAAAAGARSPAPHQLNGAAAAVAEVAATPPRSPFSPGQVSPSPASSPAPYNIPASPGAPQQEPDSSCCESANAIDLSTTAGASSVSASTEAIAVSPQSASRGNAPPHSPVSTDLDSTQPDL